MVRVDTRRAFAFASDSFVDTEFDLQRIVGRPHSVTLRFMLQFANSYYNDFIGEGVNGSYVIAKRRVDSDGRDPPGLAVAIGNNYVAYDLPGGLVERRWYDLSFTVDWELRPRMYLDGLELAVSDSAGGATLASGAWATGTLVLGQRMNPAVRPYEQFFGLLDDVAVWDHALSAAELSTLAQERGLIDGAPGLIAGWTADDVPVSRANQSFVLRGGAAVVANTGTDADASSLPAIRQTPTMSLPLRGEWTIIQGTDRPVVPSPAVPYSHRGWAAFCLDFGELQETEAKGQPVVAVADGTVVFLRDTSPDTQSNEQVPGCVRCAPDNPNDISCAYEPNEVLIKHADNEYSSYLHLEQGSVPATIKQRLATGDLVRAGEQIGLLGRSGTAGYHLHFAYLRDPVLPDERGLNPGEDTPLPGECGYSRAVPSYTEIITRPFEFSNYQVRRLDGTFIGVGRGTPQENEVVRAGSGCLSALAQLVRSWL